MMIKMCIRDSAQGGYLRALQEYLAGESEGLTNRVRWYTQYYNAVRLADGTVCLFQYDYAVHWCTPELQNALPDFQTMHLLSLAAVCLGAVALYTRRSARIVAPVSYTHLLPVYGIYHLFSLNAAAEAANTFVLYWAKLLACLTALGCAWMVRRLALRLEVPAGRAGYASLAFLLSPLTLVGVFCMGQYDSLCLFFLLWALCLYFDGRLPAFTVLIGVAMACKFFALLVFLPLLLLREKRISRLLGYGVLSLWLTVPTGLLYAGRDGDMGFFNELMIQRLFTDTVPGAHTDVPLFFLVYTLILAFCFFWRAPDLARLRLSLIHI